MIGDPRFGVKPVYEPPREPEKRYRYVPVWECWPCCETRPWLGRLDDDGVMPAPECYTCGRPMHRGKAQEQCTVRFKQWHCRDCNSTWNEEEGAVGRCPICDVREPPEHSNCRSVVPDADDGRRTRWP